MNSMFLSFCCVVKLRTQGSPAVLTVNSRVTQALLYMRLRCLHQGHHLFPLLSLSEICL